MKGEYVLVDPNVMTGKPVLRGTRITVEHVLERLVEGESVEEILEALPWLNSEMVLGAIGYALKVLKSETTHVTPTP